MAIKYRGTAIPFAKHSDATTDRAVKEIPFPGVNGTYEMHMVNQNVNQNGATINHWRSPGRGTQIEPSPAPSPRGTATVTEEE